MTDAIKEVLRDLLRDAIETLYDDPSGLSREELRVLLIRYEEAAEFVGLDYSAVIISRSEYEIDRIRKLLS